MLAVVLWDIGCFVLSCKGCWGRRIDIFLADDTYVDVQYFASPSSKRAGFIHSMYSHVFRNYIAKFSDLKLAVLREIQVDVWIIWPRKHVEFETRLHFP